MRASDICILISECYLRCNGSATCAERCAHECQMGQQWQPAVCAHLSFAQRIMSVRIRLPAPQQLRCACAGWRLLPAALRWAPLLAARQQRALTSCAPGHCPSCRWVPLLVSFSLLTVCSLAVAAYAICERC